ncbi:MAG: hypothetical protein JJU31_06655 [Wenzhouxiangella sp.]|nr:hypothetical protein [Wenzhouxiangella sp.]MCH8477445.1 hypothetical protein [Wenzhouxiangella sp.]TVR95330.1 MAG: hypothetical protein EA418_07650 [Wenzhouxiangellaceae bacterium]
MSAIIRRWLVPASPPLWLTLTDRERFGLKTDDLENPTMLAFPPTRLLAGIAAGLAVSLVLSEGLLALLALSVGEFSRLAPESGPPYPSAASLALNLLVWMMAAATAAALASAVDGLRAPGWIAGGLWLPSAILVAGLGSTQEVLPTLAGLVVSIGAIAGTEAGVRIERAGD